MNESVMESVNERNEMRNIGQETNEGTTCKGYLLLMDR